MAWSKEQESSYAHQAKKRAYLIDCVECESPITPKERDENKGMCNYCYEEIIRKCS